MADRTIQAEALRIRGDDGTLIDAYAARPLDGGPHPGVVVLHHLPGWDGPSKEIVRTLAVNGYLALMPHLFHRYGGTPEEAATVARQRMGVPDAQMVADLDGAVRHLGTYSTWNGKVGVVGFCSGGRQAWIAAAKLDLDAVVSAYGRRIVSGPDDVTEDRPEPPLDLTPQIGCPVLGIFGEDDENPSPEHRAVMAEALDRHGKEHEFHSYEGAGHAFMDVFRDNYRPASAKDAWTRMLDFLARHLAT